MNKGKEASIRSSLTPCPLAPAFQKTRLSKEVSLLTVKLSARMVPHPVLSILWFMCPQLSWNLPSMPLVSMQSHLPRRQQGTRRGRPNPLPRQVPSGRLSKPPSPRWTYGTRWIRTTLTRASSKQLQRKLKTRTARNPADEEPPG